MILYQLRYLLVPLYTIFWSLLACFVGVVDRRGDLVNWMGTTWLRWIYSTCQIRVKVAGLNHIDQTQTYVIMCNHQSLIDVGALVLALPIRWRFVAKRELTWIPLFGWALFLSNHILIDRSNRPRAVETLRKAARRVRADVNVIIFPEGTRSKTGELQEFKSGGFHLALEAGVPILPVTVSGSRKITPKGTLSVRSGVVKAQFGKPIPTHSVSLTGRDQLKRQVHDAILEGFDPSYQTMDL